MFHEREFIFYQLSHCHFLEKKSAPHTKQDYCSHRTNIDVLSFLITVAKYWEPFFNVTAFFLRIRGKTKVCHI